MNRLNPKIFVLPLRIILFLSLFYSVQYAQPIRFKNLSVNDGLSHNTVTAFCEDRFGYMWIGTGDGLNRFDGARFTIFRNDPADSTSISDNSILSIYEDKDGYLWIGTENGGLNRFDPKTESFKAFYHNSDNPNSIGYNSVSCIAGDRYGNLWIGTKKGLNKLPYSEKNKINPSFINYFAADNNNSITDNVIYSLRIDMKGSIWLSLSNGFGVDKLDFTDSTYTRFNKTNFRNNSKNQNSLSGDWVLYTFEDSKGRIWIASWNAGLNKFEPSKMKFTNFNNDPNNKESIGSNYIEMITEDDSGNIWVAAYDGGLNKFVEADQGKPEHFINYKYDNMNSNSLPDNRAVILYKDRSGIIWIGTAGHGLSRFAPHSRFFNITFKSGNEKSNYKPSAIIKTFDGKLWVGTYEGELFRLTKEGKILNSYKLPVIDKPTRNFPLITSLCEDEFNTLWIATTRSGLFYIDKRTLAGNSPQIVHVEQFKASPPLSYPNGYMLVRETPDKRLLIGTYNGLGGFIFPREEKQNKKLVHYTAVNFPFPWAYESGDDSFWMGSFYNGICNVSLADLALKCHFIYMPLNPKDKNSLPHGDVYTILKSKDNSIWFGTLKSLSRLNPATGELTHLTSKDGLANESVYGLLEDKNGSIWISTYNGLSKLDTKTMLFTNFFSEDGIQANEFNQFSYYKDKEGLLYFGGINGITVIDPGIDMSKISFPKIKFTGLYIFNARQQVNSLIKEGILKCSFNYSNEIVLPYDKEAFTIEFSALELESPQKIKYKYKLEGYNDDWVQLRPAQHSVSFMNLGHKSYIFKLMSTNKDGIWNPEIAELKITITPPFYNTLWFKFFAALIIVGAVVFTYQYRIRRSIRRQNELQNLVNEKTAELKERNADLESFSYSVSHDLRTPLRSIYSFSQIINEDYGHQLSDEAKIYFQKITNAAVNMTNLIDGILKMAQIARSEINKKSVNLSEIALHTIDNIKREYPDKNISAEIEPNLVVFGDPILLTTVIENLISNSIKFSMIRETIQIEFGKTRAFDRTKSAAEEVLYIKDNGTGFDMKYSEKLFQVFQRLHSTGEFSGTGIGLANVKKIIARHGGSIWAEGEVDKGAIFFFTI